MTTLITQKTTSDCSLACIAMAAGLDYDEFATPEVLDRIVASKGMNGEAYDDHLQRAGFEVGSYWCVRPYESYSRHGFVRVFLRGRRAILSVPSLNIRGGYHAVYWDGHELYDPNPEYKERYKYIESLAIEAAYIFDEVKR